MSFFLHVVILLVIICSQSMIRNTGPKLTQIAAKTCRVLLRHRFCFGATQATYRELYKVK